MGDDEIGVVSLEIERRDGDHHPGQSADRRKSPAHRPYSIGTTRRTRPPAYGGDEGEDLDAGRNRHGLRRGRKEAERDRRQAGGEHVVHPEAEAQEAGADGRQHDPRIADDRPLREGRHDHRQQRDGRQEDDVDLGVAENPEQVLPEDRIAAARRIEERPVEQRAPSRTRCRRRSAAGRRTGSSRRRPARTRRRAASG